MRNHSGISCLPRWTCYDIIHFARCIPWYLQQHIGIKIYHSNLCFLNPCKLLVKHALSGFNKLHFKRKYLCRDDYFFHYLISFGALYATESLWIQFAYEDLQFVCSWWLIGNQLVTNACLTHYLNMIHFISFEKP